MSGERHHWLYHGVSKHVTDLYDRITKYIYIGTNLCCDAHFAKLLKLGFAADLDLEAERIERPPQPFRHYLRIPIRNHHAPTQQQFKKGVAFIDKFVKAKKKIYVHCKNGHGRSPTMVAAYFVRKGKNVKEAIGFLKKRRHGMHLQKVQIEALHRWAKIQQKK